jgi:hypothetical protein
MQLPQIHEPIESKGFKTLDYVVQNVMLDLGETGGKEYQRYLQWAIRGIKEMGKWTNISIKTIVLPIVNGVADLPDDYMRYTKVGVPMSFQGSNVIYILGLNPELAKNRQLDECGASLTEAVNNTVTTESHSLSTHYFSNYHHNGQYVAGMYGVGGGFSARTYDIDHERHQMIFSSDVLSDYVVLEYISTGISVHKDTLIKEAAIETLIAWIHWQRLENKRGTPMWERTQKRLLYVSNLELLRKFDTVFTGQEYLDIARGAFHQTPKH